MIWNKKSNKMYWCPELCIYTQKSTRIWKVYLNDSKCTWKVSILLYKQSSSCNQALGCLRLYGNSRVSPAQPRINAYEILLQHDWLLIFSRQNRLAEMHCRLQLSYHITDRLLAAGNYLKPWRLREINNTGVAWEMDSVTNLPPGMILSVTILPPGRN